MDKIKAVIFDMDGLLIDSEPLWQDAELSVFSSVGVPLTREMTRQTMGLHVDEVVDHWYARHPWSQSTKKVIADRIVKKVIELILDRAVPLDGAKEVVERFAKQNTPIAIASSSQTEIINAVLEKIPVRKYVKVIHSAEEETYGKPHPATYLSTAKKLGIEPQYCLAIEDSQNGILSAKRAGMTVYGVNKDAVIRKKLQEAGADKVFASLMEVSK